MPQTDPYLDNVYALLQQNYGENMTKTAEEFAIAMQGDSAYVANVHSLLSQSYPDNFQYSIEEFNAKFKAPEEENPQYAEMFGDTGYDFSEVEKKGFVGSLGTSVSEFTTKQLPSMYADFAIGLNRAGSKLTETLMPDSPAMNALNVIDALSAAEAAGISKEFKESVDFSGMATELSDIYDKDTGEFKPENIGSFAGYALGQTLPQLLLGFITGGASFMPMGVSEAVSAQTEAFEAQGRTPADVFVSGDDRVLEEWAAGITIGLLDKFSFGKLGGGSGTLKTLKDVFKHTSKAGVTELVTEMTQETVGAVSGVAATRDWDKVNELLTDSDFWYNRVGTAGVMGLIGSGSTASVTGGFKAIRNNMSAETKQDVENLAGEMGIVSEDVDVQTAQLSESEKLMQAENAKLKEQLNKLAEENGTKIQTGQVVESLDAAANRIANITDEAPAPKTKGTKTKAEKATPTPKAKPTAKAETTKTKKDKPAEKAGGTITEHLSNWRDKLSEKHQISKEDVLSIGRLIGSGKIKAAREHAKMSKITGTKNKLGDLVGFEQRFKDIQLDVEIQVEEETEYSEAWSPSKESGESNAKFAAHAEKEGIIGRVISHDIVDLDDKVVIKAGTVVDGDVLNTWYQLPYNQLPLVKEAYTEITKEQSKPKPKPKAKVEKAKPASKAKKAKVQEPAKVSPTKPVVQEKKVQKEHVKKGKQERVMKAGKMVDAPASKTIQEQSDEATEKEMAKELAQAEEERIERAKDAEEKASKIALENKAHSVVTKNTSESKKNKVTRLKKIIAKAKGKAGETAIPNVQKRIDALETEMLETKEHSEHLAERKAKKEAVPEVVEEPKRKGSKYIGKNESNQDIFETPKGTRIIIDSKGEKVQSKTERTKHTPTELKNRRDVRAANNRKVTAFQKKMVKVQERVIGYAAKVKSTKDAGTKALYQDALKEAQAEADALTKELKEYRKNPDANRTEGNESGLTFTDNTKIETAIAAAKEKAKLTPKKALPKKKMGRQKETLSDKDRSPAMPSEKVRRENAERAVGELMAMLNDRSELSNLELDAAMKVRDTATLKHQKAIDAALERVAERGKQAAKDKAVADLNEDLIGGKDIDFDHFDDYYISDPSGDIAPFLTDKGGKGSISATNSKKMSNAGELVTQMKGGKIGSVVARVTAQLLDKLNALRAKYNMPAIEFYVADELTVKKGNTTKEIAGVHTTANGRTAIILTKEGLSNAHILAHELLHGYHAIFNSMTESLTDTKGAHTLTKVGKAFDKEIQDLFVSTKKEWSVMLDDYFNGELKDTELSDLLDEMVESGYDLNNLYGFTDHKEFLAEGLSEAGFASILNSMRVDSGRRLEANDTVFKRLAQAVMGTVKFLGLVKPDTVLNNLVASLENVDRAERSPTTSMLKGMGFKRSYKTKKETARFKAVKQAVLSRIKTTDDVKKIVEQLNKKLPEGKKITKREIQKITTLAKKGVHTAMVNDVVDKMKKLTNPKNFLAADSKPKVVKGKAADADTIRLMEQIWDRLTKTHTEDTDRAAYKRYEELNKKLLLGGELSVAEELDLELIRYELAHDLSPEAIDNLLGELRVLRKEGALERRKWLDQRRNEKKLRIEVGLKQLLEGKELTEKSYQEAMNKQTPSKEKGLWKNFITGLGEKSSSWGQKNESFHSLLDLLGGKQKGTSAMGTFFNKSFGIAERKAFIKKNEIENSWNKEIMGKLKELFPSDKKKSDQNHFNDVLEHLGEERYEITYIAAEGSKHAGEELTNKYSLDQLANIYVWSKQLATEGSFLKHGYDADFLNQVEAMLNQNPKAKALADWMLTDFYPSKYNDINAVYRERTGHDLTQVDFYSPLVYDYSATVEDAGVALDTYNPVASTLRSMVLKRQSNRQKLDFKTGLLSNANRHIENSAHFIAYDKFVADLRSFFKDSSVKKAMEMRFGSNVNKVMNTYIEAFAQENIFRSFLHNTIDKLRANLVTTFLGVNPTIYFKQLTSAIAYSVHMPEGSTSSWKAMQAAAAVPNSKASKEASKWKKLIQNHSVFEARKKRGQRTVGEAYQSLMGGRMFGEATGNSTVQKMQRWMMNMVKAGDMGAIAHGGWPVLKAAYDLNVKQGMSSKAAMDSAFVTFIDSTLSAQQSTATGDLSNIQLDNNAIVRLFTAFTTTPMQYLRNSKSAARAFKRNGWLKTKEGRKAGMQLAMYGVVLPMFFEMVSQAGNIFFTDDDEQERLLMRLMYAPVNSALTANHILGGIANTAIRASALGEDFGSYGGLVASASGLVNQAAKTMMKMSQGEEISEKEYIKFLDFLTMLKGGMAIGNAVELGLGFNKSLGADGDWRNALGWSDYALGRSNSTISKPSVSQRPSIERDKSPRRRLLNRRLNRRR